ncbi:MAG: hypothetical protein JXR48_15530 [Candidatus Delongbacteria bacterium]|nr:hypothetical protein [Candidatus Delongbacteria bacterium]MBN2836367.1 hypothetical protein [Candidatus Delongbacteria bacterium]
MNKIISAVLIFVFSLFGFEEFMLYDNLNLSYPSAQYIETFDEVFGFLPLETTELTKVKTVLFSISTDVTRGGKFGQSYDRLENIDPFKSVSIIWNHRHDFMPYLFYNTPFRSIVDDKYEREYHRKQDQIGLGFVSRVEDNILSFGIDYNLSGFKERYQNTDEDYKKVQGISVRGKLDLKTGYSSTLHLGVISPVWMQDELDNVDKDKYYFQGLTISGGLEYLWDKNVFRSNTVYREFENSGEYRNEWLVEQGFSYTRIIQEELRLSISYDYIPSVFEVKPDYLLGDRHRIGFATRMNIENVYVNIGVLDSTLLSEEELAQLVFKVDFAYNF